MDRFIALETFVRVVDLGSYTAAARQLGMSQSGASKAVTRLEAELGVRLLHRSTRQLNLTDVGERLHECAKGALALIDAAIEDARSRARSPGGRLRIAASEGFARRHVLAQLPRFLNEHPEVEVDVVVDDVADAAEARIDICFRHSEPTRKISGSRRIGSARHIVVASPDYLDRHGTPQCPADLAGHQLVVWSADRAANTWHFDHGGDVIRMELRGRLRVDSREGMRDALLAGGGVAVVSEWDVAGELTSGDLVRLLSPWHLPPDEIWAVPSGGRLASPAVRHLIEFIETSLKAGVSPLIPLLEN